MKVKKPTPDTIKKFTALKAGAKLLCLDNTGGDREEKYLVEGKIYHLKRVGGGSNTLLRLEEFPSQTFFIARFKIITKLKIG